MPGRLIGVAHPRLLRANAHSKLAQILVFYMRTVRRDSFGLKHEGRDIQPEVLRT